VIDTIAEGVRETLTLLGIIDHYAEEITKRPSTALLLVLLLPRLGLLRFGRGVSLVEFPGSPSAIRDLGLAGNVEGFPVASNRI